MEFIPDLSEIQNDNLARQVADAPSVSISRFMRSTLELEDEVRAIEKKVVAATGVTIEVGLLIRCLEGADALDENDRPWNYQSVIQVIKAQLHLN
ncbi:hypothetical protein BIW11_14351 [Tropilaelaps mercedesae]|uniref:Uncharacterized protein n=1 Tax=Tropilaelaps mercedesae TaxID=418985 RepID=A0A1V9WY49_9ACAR|nr:hypothetical protein BIW11_14351 [Tropilaelaps mercedesae]